MQLMIKFDNVIVKRNRIYWRQMLMLITTNPYVLDDPIHLNITVMILSFRIDRSGLTVQTQSSLIRVYTLFLQFRLHRLDPLLFGKAILFKF